MIKLLTSQITNNCNIHLSFKFILLFFLVHFDLMAEGKKIIETDICIYGGTSAGVVAAVSGSRLGKRTLIVEPKGHLGGLTSGGLGETDDGYRYSITGISREFYRRVGTHYGRLENFSFEPHVAENVFLDLIREENIPVYYHYRVVGTKKINGILNEIILENSINPKSQPHIIIKAKEFIDCSYEGDLMAKSGVSYTYGREANDVYKEKNNGVEPGGRHQFVDSISPYKIEGDPTSGLVWGVSPIPLASTGFGDKKIQAYCFRICMTADPDNKIPITRPKNYDSTKYELLVRVLKKVQPKSIGGDGILILSKMPGCKTDINSGWGAGMSTDYIMGNWEYPDATYEEREKIWKDHEEYTKGLIYFLASDYRVPIYLRQEMMTYGYPKDEYVDNNGFSHELYIREARRMIGPYIMTEHNCLGEVSVKDGIASASYNMDSHNVQTIIINDMVKNEGEVTVHLPGPYPISYRSITPFKNECKNLLVPVCLSASHIAYGSIRMEPVFMQLGQAAGMAAAMAINYQTSVQEIDVSKLQAIQKTNPYLSGIKPDRYIFISDSTLVHTQGNWEKRTEIQWASKTPFLFANPSKSKTMVHFSVKTKKDAKLGVYLYNPRATVGLSQKEIPVIIRRSDSIDTTRISLALNQTSNTCLIRLGFFLFKKDKKNVIIIGDGASEVPIQVGYLVLVPEYWEKYRGVNLK